MVRRRSSSRSRSSRRPTFAWAAGDVNFTLTNGAVAGSVQIPLLSTFETNIGGDLVGWTIRRILLTGLVTQRITTVAGETDNVCLGIAFSNPAIPAGTIIDPGNPAEYLDWMYYEEFFVYTGPAMAVDSRDPQEAQVWKFHRDLSPMRRYRDIADVATVLAQNASGSSSRCSLFWRVLLSKA